MDLSAIRSQILMFTLLSLLSFPFGIFINRKENIFFKKKSEVKITKVVSVEDQL